MLIHEKKHRLNPELYKGRIRVTFTVCTESNMPLFTSPEVVDVFTNYLKLSNDKYQIKNYCYVFMPDHIHILNEGKDITSDLLMGIRLFKQYGGYWASQNRKYAVLQKDYYDHIHRMEEDLLAHIRYILNNPVRGGLVKRWQDYRFTGSLDYKLEELLT